MSSHKIKGLTVLEEQAAEEAEEEVLELVPLNLLKALKARVKALKEHLVPS